MIIAPNSLTPDELESIFRANQLNGRYFRLFHWLDPDGDQERLELHLRYVNGSQLDVHLRSDCVEVWWYGRTPEDSTDNQTGFSKPTLAEALEAHEAKRYVAKRYYFDVPREVVRQLGVFDEAEWEQKKRERWTKLAAEKEAKP